MASVSLPAPVPVRRRRRAHPALWWLLVLAGGVAGLLVLHHRRSTATAIESPLLAVDRTGGGHFVVKTTGARFVLRGFDYQPLQTLDGPGSNQFQNESFAPAYYRSSQVASMMSAWQREGYNTVRVLLAPDQIGNPGGRGLDPAYLENLANFLETAQQHGVRTLITIGALPSRGGYTPKGTPDFGPINDSYLNPTFIAAEQRYLGDLVEGLQRDGAPLVDALWELKGEQEWDNDSAPLNWQAGTVVAANGHSYDMASAASRTAMENQGLVYWANRLTATIHRLLPGSLVGVGAYPASVKRQKWTVQVSELFRAATKVNFVDVHLYPNLGPELAQLASFHAGDTTKPVIMGEFGATRNEPLDLAAASLVTWQRQSCHLAGLSITGWLLWTWNSSAQKEFWDARAGGDTLARALAPVTRPNPCAA